MQLFQLKGCKLTLLSIATKNKLMFYPEMYKLHPQDLHRLAHQRGMSQKSMREIKDLPGGG